MPRADVKCDDSHEKHVCDIEIGMSAFGYIVSGIVIGAPVLAIVALIMAAQQHRFQFFDVGTLLLPPVVFIAIGSFRPEIHIGFAMLFWPIIIAVVSMYAFALKVLAIDKTLSHPVPFSAGLFLSSLLVAIVLGAAVPPWYE
jgi:hypothetical protein